LKIPSSIAILAAIVGDLVGATPGLVCLMMGLVCLMMVSSAPLKTVTQGAKTA
jgi:hypothetical protein